MLLVLFSNIVLTEVLCLMRLSIKVHLLYNSLSVLKGSLCLYCVEKLKSKQCPDPMGLRKLVLPYDLMIGNSSL